MQIKQREPITAIILSIVTCGIYGIIWVIDLMKGACSVKDANDTALVEIILGLFFPCLGFYLAEQKLAAGCAARGIPHKDNAILYLVLGLVFPIAAYYLLQVDLNEIAKSGN